MIGQTYEGNRDITNIFSSHLASFNSTYDGRLRWEMFRFFRDELKKKRFL